MQLRPLSRDEVRGIDRRAIEKLGLPGIVLMENAGRGTAELLKRLGIDGPVVIVAGKGNNGGDGFVIARHLDLRGYKVRVLLVADPDELEGDAATNWRVLQNAAIPSKVLGAKPDLDELDEALAGAAWIVDGLLGTGARGELRPPFPAVIDGLNAAAAPKLAVDLPSGLDCDTGEPLGTCVEAAHTATFVARKRGFDAPGAARHTGRVHVIDIGVPRVLLEPYVRNRSG